MANVKWKNDRNTRHKYEPAKLISSNIHEISMQAYSKRQDQASHGHT